MYRVRRRKYPTSDASNGSVDVGGDVLRRRSSVSRSAFLAIAMSIFLYFFLNMTSSAKKEAAMPLSFQQREAIAPIRRQRKKKRPPLLPAEQRAPVIAAEPAIVDNDDADKLDFSGGHNMHKAYRLGDVFVVWYLIWQSFDKLLHNYAKAYPNTLAHLYLLEAREAQYAHRNLTALLKAMAGKEKTMHYRRATEDELVVHLRLGDVLTDPEYANLNITIQDLWNQKEGFLCFDASVKYNYNKVEFKELLRRIPEKATKKIKKCVIVGADGFLTNEKHGSRNHAYKELVHSFLRDSLHCEVSYYASRNPDKDLMYMASAHWIITAMGGFAQVAAACVTARRGWGHAIYDKFNGEIAGWNDRRFTKKEKKIFRKEYIDWNRVHLPKNL